MDGPEFGMALNSELVNTRGCGWMAPNWRPRIGSQYKGGDMKSVHRGMALTDVEFDALVEDLVKALDKFNVPLPEKAALIGVLAPMRADIVEKKQLQILAGQ